MRQRMSELEAQVEALQARLEEAEPAPSPETSEP
jgi:BMFP domain-containing protein YqiC